MAHFGLIVDFELKEGMREAFLPLMQANARNSVEKEPGCLQFDIMQVEGEPNHLILYEVYQDEAAYEAHRKMPHLAEFLAKGNAMIAKRSSIRLVRVAANAKR